MAPAIRASKLCPIDALRYDSFKNKHSHLKFLIGWPVAIIAFIFIFKIIAGNYLTVINSIRNINLLSLTIGILCFFVIFLLRSMLWQKIIQDKGLSLNLKRGFVYFLVFEIKRYVPGNIWSFLSGSYLLEEKGLTKRNFFHAIVIEVRIDCNQLSFAFGLSHINTLFKNAYLNILILLLFLTLSLLFIFGSRLKIIGRLFSGFSSANNFYLILISIPTFFFFRAGYLFQ